MAKKVTNTELVKFAKSKVGTPYVYGSKGEKLTTNMINTFTKMYPKVFTTSYVNKAKKYVGKVCTDCSGLISWCTGVLLGSSGLYSQAKEKHPISTISKAPVGAILWRSGHVGVYIGNDKLIEAKGINYGTIESKVSSSTFTHWLIMDYIDYGNYKYSSSTTSSSTSNNKTNWIQKLQSEINRSIKDTLIAEDGIAGPKTLNSAPLLKSGSKGGTVVVLQERLKTLGYYKSNPTGTFDKTTLEAVKKFQKDKKLSVDGIVGKNTWSKLLNLS